VFSLSSSGSYAKTEAALRKALNLDIGHILDAAGKAGAAALASATPRESGLASNSWTYEVVNSAGSAKVIWHNTDVESGFPVALMLQFGYATGTGGYVAGRDYINPAIEPIFKKIEADVWKAVTSA
jgi:hypothetical protein